VTVTVTVTVGLAEQAPVELRDHERELRCIASQQSGHRLAVNAGTEH